MDKRIEENRVTPEFLALSPTDVFLCRSLGGAEELGMFLFPFGFLSRSKTNTIQRAAPQRRTAMWNKNIEGKKLAISIRPLSFAVATGIFVPRLESF